MARRPLKKRLLSSPIVIFILSWIISLVLRLLYLTCRKEYHFPEAAHAYVYGKAPAVFCFWHGRLMMHLFMKPPHRSMFVLSSRHSDGALTAQTMLRFGINSVRGSRKLGGAQAVRDLMRITESGGNICFTPDGPRGPFQVAADGAAFVAAKTGYPVLSIAFSATRHWRFNSWDKMMIPKPFSRICFVMTEPYHVISDEKNDVQTATQDIQKNLTKITAEADRLCGVSL